MEKGKEENSRIIIDTHAHIGTVLHFKMPKEMLLESMDQYGVDFALVSNIEGVEFDNDQNPIPKESQHSQKEINEEVIKFARKNASRIGVLLWIKPSTEGCTKEFEQLIIDNIDVVYGLKLHPYHAKIDIDSPKLEEYIKLAERHNLPMVIHTASSSESSPRKVYEVALRYPKVKFVMVHMGLGTDNSEAIELISRLPNLYGDTTWVIPENSLKFIEKCGADKLLFGTDSPVDGLHTYNNDIYHTYFNNFEAKISSEDYIKMMYKNAVRLFKLPIDKIQVSSDNRRKEI